MSSKLKVTVMPTDTGAHVTVGCQRGIIDRETATDLQKQLTTFLAAPLTRTGWWVVRNPGACVKPTKEQLVAYLGTTLTGDDHGRVTTELHPGFFSPSNSNHVIYWGTF